MNLPFVSVIIPTYRDWARLSICISSLKDQTYPQDSFEVIIVNNDPNDTIPDTLDLPPNFRIINEPREGSYAARNTGLKNASGEVIAFTDSDCIPSEDWLKNGVICLIGGHNIGIVAGRISLFHSSEKLNFVEVYEKYTAFKQENNAKAGSCVGANWFSYKSVIEQFGMFDANLKSNGDTVLSLRISTGGYDVVYSDSTMVSHPSRNKFSDIGNKYKRLFGGSFTRYNGNKLIFSIMYIMKFVYRRTRFNLKKFFQVSPREGIAILIVNLYLYFTIIKEAIILLKGGVAKRL